MHKRIKKLVKRFKYWLNYNPPGALTSKGWRLFEKEFKEKAPIRYWLKHNFRNALLPLKWKYEEISDWIRYRTYARYHVVETGLEPNYYDLETRMLHANFNMLKDFVEIEQAQRLYWYSDEYKEKASWCEKHLPFYYKFYPFRRPDLGIKNLDWEATLDDPTLPYYDQSPSQAQAAREIKALYIWWVKDRPARTEIDYISYNDQGLGILSSLDDDFDREAEDFKNHVKSLEDQTKQEEEWHDEDEKMFIRLIKIRRSLWA